MEAPELYKQEEPEICVLQSNEDIAEKLAAILQSTSEQVLMERENFYIGISGGSMINFLKESLKKVTTTYESWKIFFNDERVAPEDSDDSTYGACKRNLIGTIPGLTEECFIPMKQNVSPQEAAEEYIFELMKYFEAGRWPRFDILLLGLGEDGHTCSLFPGHRLLKEKEFCVCAITDSPKPPPERITFTFPVINNAALIIFVAAGAGKANAIKGILVDKDETLPAFHVQPKNGKVYWLIDQPAAKLIPHKLLK